MERNAVNWNVDLVTISCIFSLSMQDSTSGANKKPRTERLFRPDSLGRNELVNALKLVSHLGTLPCTNLQVNVMFRSSVYHVIIISIPANGLIWLSFIKNMSYQRSNETTSSQLLEMSHCPHPKLYIVSTLNNFQVVNVKWTRQLAFHSIQMLPISE